MLTILVQGEASLYLSPGLSVTRKPRETDCNMHVVDPHTALSLDNPVMELEHVINVRLPSGSSSRSVSVKWCWSCNSIFGRKRRS